MYREHRFIAEIDEENFAVIIEGDKFDTVCMVMSKSNVNKMEDELINIPSENTCVYGDNKCIFFSNNLFIVNIQNLKVHTIPKVERVFYLDTGIFAITKKLNRYDCFVKIDTDDFYVNVIGRFKYRDMIR